jgi:hypothetical protein
MAHKNERQLNRLVSHLAEDFDIYVHLDKRSSVQIAPHPRVMVLREYELYWGSLNQIRTELLLFRTAQQGGHACGDDRNGLEQRDGTGISAQQGYDRYLLISGMDVPLKTNAEIRAFFEEKVNRTREFVDFRKLPCDGWPDDGTLDRLTRWYPDWKSSRSAPGILRRLIVKLVNLRPRRPIDYEFYGGSNWLNLSKMTVEQLLAYVNEHPEYLQRYHWTWAADEIFFQTALKLIDNLDITSDPLRYIDWSAGGMHPKTLTLDDLPALEASTAHFARKIDEGIDDALIDALYERLR